MQDTTCKRCGGPLIIKQTQRKTSQLTQPYYFSAYYLCAKCGRMFHDEKFKIVNQSQNMFAAEKDVDIPVDVEIWTDGACVRNGRPDASAAWAFVSGEYEKAGRVDGKQTNNRAEAQAILEALKWASEAGKRRVRICTDSQITMHNMKKPLEKILINTDIFEKLFAVIKEQGMEVVFQKVLGHSGIPENERVDKLANTLATQQQ